MSRYTLFGESISFYPSADRFCEIQWKAWRAADKATTIFDQFYKESGNILTVLKKYDATVLHCIEQSASVPLFETLGTLNIFDVSKTTFDKACLDTSSADEALEIVAEKYNSIVAEQEDAELYRAERKANRGRVVGGGFGVGGAIKGMATAGAMNAVSGIGHSAVNAIGNMTSSIAAASAKKSLYNADGTISLLRTGVYDSVMAFFNNYMHWLNERMNQEKAAVLFAKEQTGTLDPLDLPVPVDDDFWTYDHQYIRSSFDSDKAEALFENAKKYPQKSKELLIEALEHCPWLYDLYAYIFINYPAERRHIWDIGLVYHIDLTDEVEDAISKEYTSQAKASEQEALLAKERISAIMKEFNVSTSTTFNKLEKDCLTRLVKELPREEMLNRFNTYDALDKNKASVIHNLRLWELAKKYKVSFSAQETEEILNSHYGPEEKVSEEKALAAKTKIVTIMSALDVSESSTFDTLETDCLARICKDCDSADEATCNALKESVTAYAALDKNKKPFFDKIQSRIETIWAAEDGEIFDNLLVQTNIADATAVASAIEFVKSKGRTASSKQYLLAFENCTPQMMKKARKSQGSTPTFCYVIGIAFILAGILLFFLDYGILLSLVFAVIGILPLTYASSLKKAWNILTINGTVVHSLLRANTKGGAKK